MSDDAEDGNEILSAVRQHKERARAGREARKRGNWPLGALALGAGIGSAAVAAAVLYTGRNKTKRTD